ncbi:MAG: hypothetical protein GY947_16525 [Rhodobacteraceae bacterium]|nr:hypothetical protein [Paracoccaceae bacterium]
MFRAALIALAVLGTNSMANAQSEDFVMRQAQLLAIEVFENACLRTFPEFEKVDRYLLKSGFVKDERQSSWRRDGVLVKIHKAKKNRQKSCFLWSMYGRSKGMSPDVLAMLKRQNLSDIQMDVRGIRASAKFEKNGNNGFLKLEPMRMGALHFTTLEVSRE